MHLLYVTASLPFTSGETFIVPEILELQRRGHDVTVIPTRPLRSTVHEDATRLTASSQPLLSRAVLRGAVSMTVHAPRSSSRSAAIIARSRSPRVMLKNAATLPKALWVGRFARRHDVDHIHAHFASTPATVALVASEASGIPWSFTAHRWDIGENNLLRQKVASASFARAIDGRGYERVSRVAGTDGHKVRMIHMGVQVETAAPLRRRAPRRPFRVLVAARFAHVKGHRYVLEAAARLSSDGHAVVVDCAGDGPLRPAMEDYASTLGIGERVRFLGTVDHPLLLERLRTGDWDAAVLPSVETDKDWEGIPVALIEAMAAGVPVIATSTGGIPELLRDGAGVLVPARDPGALADALLRLATDFAFRDRVAAAGLRRARCSFEIGQTTSALLDAIHSACG